MKLRRDILERSFSRRESVVETLDAQFDARPYPDSPIRADLSAKHFTRYCVISRAARLLKRFLLAVNLIYENQKSQLAKP